MGEKPQQIERHIEETRSELADNLSELQEKVKNSLDWRAQFRERPMTMIGIAFGGGVLLSALTAGRRSQSSPERDDFWTENGRPVNQTVADFQSQTKEFIETKRNTADIWENIKGALMGLAASKASQYLDQVVPGFQDQYRKAATERQASSPDGDAKPIRNVVM